MAPDTYKATVILNRAASLGAAQSADVLGAIGLAREQDVRWEISKRERRLVILARQQTGLSHRKGVVRGGPQKKRGRLPPCPFSVALLDEEVERGVQPLGLMVQKHYAQLRDFGGQHARPDVEHGDRCEHCDDGMADPIVR